MALLVPARQRPWIESARVPRYPEATAAFGVTSDPPPFRRRSRMTEIPLDVTFAILDQLVAHGILDYRLPFPEVFLCRPRHKKTWNTLLQCALVSRAWRDYLVPRLFSRITDVQIFALERVTSLVALLEENPTLASHITSLQFSMSYQTHRARNRYRTASLNVLYKVAEGGNLLDLSLEEFSLNNDRLVNILKHCRLRSLELRRWSGSESFSLRDLSPSISSLNVEFRSSRTGNNAQNTRPVFPYLKTFGCFSWHPTSTKSLVPPDFSGLPPECRPLANVETLIIREPLSESIKTLPPGFWYGVASIPDEGPQDYGGIFKEAYNLQRLILVNVSIFVGRLPEYQGQEVFLPPCPRITHLEVHQDFLILRRHNPTGNPPDPYPFNLPTLCSIIRALSNLQQLTLLPKRVFYDLESFFYPVNPVLTNAEVAQAFQSFANWEEFDQLLCPQRYPKIKKVVVDVRTFGTKGWIARQFEAYLKRKMPSLVSRSICIEVVY
ncbi:hypothetical protein CC2G_010038 [Coprinopsis cinerea AmutBmut pab1-1]|nr:hypothetical protein CC2G_010038 [Coprinopsis cinerea AmutBmut pab1-1]